MYWSDCPRSISAIMRKKKNRKWKWPLHPPTIDLQQRSGKIFFFLRGVDIPALAKSVLKESTMKRGIRFFSMVLAAFTFLSVGASDSQAFWWGCCYPRCYSSCYKPCCSPCTSCCPTAGCSTGSCASGTCGASLEPRTKTAKLLPSPQLSSDVVRRSANLQRRAGRLNTDSDRQRRTVDARSKRIGFPRTADRRSVNPVTRTSRASTARRTTLLDSSVSLGLSRG